MPDNRSKRQIWGISSTGLEQVANGALRASNWMTRPGPNFEPWFEVWPSGMAADEQEMAE